MSHLLSAYRRSVVVVLVISALVGLAAAKINTSGQLGLGVAASQVLIDFPGPSVVEREASEADITTLNKHAELYAELMTTLPVRAAIARRAQIPAGGLSAVARLNPSVPLPLRQPESEPRASQIAASHAPYRLELQSAPWRPILYIYAAAPSAPEAEGLANAALTGLQDVLKDLAHQQGYPAGELPRLRQLGVPRAMMSNGKAKPIIGLMTFIVAFSLTATTLLATLWLRVRGPRTAVPEPRRAFDDWPNTNRVLPWSVAVFMSVLWLSPFDLVELTVKMPIDMKLDRLLLPPLVVIWLLALATGGRARPRFRITSIHAAVGVFVAIAFLSVVLNAQYLNHIGELTLTVKRLPYLLAYIVLFLIVSTAIRPTEVRAFMTLSLALAVIVAIGIIWEYRFTTNIFRLIADRVAVGPLTFVGDSVSSTALDSQGRRGISGPAQVGLEAVSMMALGLPIAVLRLSSAKGRKRLVYAVAVCLLIAGIFATGRKSGFIAPVAVFVTLAYFRRRELLRLAPIGLVMAIVVTAASPDVVRGVLTQFTASDRGNVATTSDRVADYDAVRPDVWSHLIFGRGFGSYNPDTYRLLDSEILSRVIETGVIGLLSFLAIAVTVVLAGRRTIARRESEFAPHALVGAVAGVVFVVVSTLFDVTAFPHVTYIFFFIAALASLSIGYDAPDSTPPEPSEGNARTRWSTSSSLDASPAPARTLV